MKKLDKGVFIEKSKNFHGDTYDYSLVEYKNVRTKVKIICPKHGIFEQLPWTHMNGNGCSKCQNLSKDEFIRKSTDIHDKQYNYDLVEIKNNKSKVKIICPEHGIFEQSPSSHMNGSGCPKCFKENNRLKVEDFIKRSNEIHDNKYNYILVKYTDNKQKVKIICPKHGLFEQTPQHHLNGHGCNLCVRIINTENFIKKSKEKHGDVYDYSNTIYLSRKNKVRIICKNHGNFLQFPMSHLCGRGCPLCSSSHGENRIYNFLKSNEIEFSRQKTFDGCKNKRNLSFDFFIPKFNMCIEYNGEQHYISNEHFGGKDKLVYTKRNDNIKKEYCEINNIRLLVIKYNENVEEILKSTFCS